MKLQMAIAGVVVGAVCAALLLALRRAIDRRQAADRQLAALSATVKTLQSRVAELSRRTPPEHEIEPISVVAENSPEPKTLAILAAAATAFLGKTAHIRSVSSIPGATADVSPWSQQGRVIVQTSHNLRGANQEGRNRR